MEKSNFKDFFMNKIFSRKMIVWIVACVLLCFKFIDQNTWLIVSLGYVGINATLSAINSIKTVNKEVIEQITTTSDPDNKEVVEQTTTTSEQTK